MADYYILYTSRNDIKGYQDTEGKSVIIEWRTNNTSPIISATISKNGYEILKEIPAFRQDLQNYVIAVLKRPADLSEPEKKINVEHSYEFYKNLSPLVEQEKKQVEAENLTREDLIIHLANATTYLKMQGNAYNSLVAHHMAACMLLAENGLAINPEEILNAAKKITQGRLDIGEIHAEARKVNAIQGALGKAKGEKGQKDENAKKMVKQKWEEWQKNPTQYENTAQFATHMALLLNKQQKEGLKVSVVACGTIQAWCTEWKKEQK